MQRVDPRDIEAHALLVDRGEAEASSASASGSDELGTRSLLAGGTDKDIAAAMEIGVYTAREHVATLYRKFDVSSRTELMALWLGRGD